MKNVEKWSKKVEKSGLFENHLPNENSFFRHFSSFFRFFKNHQKIMKIIENMVHHISWI